MDFGDNLKELINKIIKYREKITNEEMTKTAFIMPFFDTLGYDTRNPFEFMPEYTADIADSKGEKVDYAILINDVPQILIEAKPVNDNLEKHDKQLMRYFHASKAKIGILTNGIVYKFFTDLEEKNKMDLKPFLEIDLLNLKDNQVLELKKFLKPNFDIENILSTAEVLKYSNSIKKLLQQQFTNPDENFVNYVLTEIYDGIKTQKVKDKFQEITKRSITQLLNDMVRSRFEDALDGNASATSQEEVEVLEAESKIDTTQEELEGYAMIKAILSEFVNPADINYKDTVRYFNILLENNIRKWICRLYFNSSNKCIAFPEQLDGEKTNKEEKIALDSITDIYKYKTRIIESLKLYQ